MLRQILIRYRYLIYLLLLLPSFIVRDYTPQNELKYISIVEEALCDGTWFTFYNHGEVYADKPPLYFWLIMWPRLLTGGYQMWILGLFSLLPAVGTCWIMDKWLTGQQVRHNPLVSGWMLGTTIMFIGSALVLRMDMLMVFFITLSLYTFFRIYKNQHKPYERWMLPVYVFLGIFSKGAIGFLFPMVSMVAFLAVKGELKQIGRYFGWKQWGVLLGLCAVWFSIIYAEGGNEYLNNLVFKQTVGRGVNSFHHKRPFYYYFPRIPHTFAPWIVLYVVLIWKGVRHKMLGDDTAKFFWVAALSNFILLSLISSKLEIYLLPVYPFVAYLGAKLLAELPYDKGIAVSVAIPAVIFALIFPVSFFLNDAVPMPIEDFTWMRVAMFCVSAGSVYALWCLYKRNIRDAIIGIAGGMLLMVFFSSFGMGQINRYIGLRELALEAGEMMQTEKIDRLAYFRYPAASNMDIYLDRQLEYTNSVTDLDSVSRLSGETLLFIREREYQRNEEVKKWLEPYDRVLTNGEWHWYRIGSLHANGVGK